VAEEGSNDVKTSDIKGPERSREESAGWVQKHAPSEPAPVGRGEPERAEGEEDPLAAARRDAEANRDRWMRAVAELENFKRRSLQEKNKLLKYRDEELLRDLLPVMDNLERAISHCTGAGRTDAVMEGLLLVTNMFKDILARHQVTEIKALGQPFDPHVHEAIARVSAPRGKDNVVMEEVEKGYMYQDRLLRPAKVVVATAEGK